MYDSCMRKHHPSNPPKLELGQKGTISLAGVLDRAHLSSGRVSLSSFYDEARKAVVQTGGILRIGLDDSHLGL